MFSEFGWRVDSLCWQLFILTVPFLQTNTYFYTGNKFKQVPLIQVTSGGQRSLLKKKLQVCESQKSCLFVGDQILIFHYLQINSSKILQCIFSLILSVIVEVYLWWKELAQFVAD